MKLPTFYAEDSAASANEVWSRLHSDPLFAVSGPSLDMKSDVSAICISNDTPVKLSLQICSVLRASPPALRVRFT